MPCELTHFAIGKHAEYRVQDPEIKLAALGLFNVTGSGPARRLIGQFPVRVALHWDDSSWPTITDILPLWDGFAPISEHPAKKPPHSLSTLGHAPEAIERSLADFPEPMMPAVFDFGLDAGDQLPSEAELAQTWAVITGGILYDEALRELSCCLAWFIGRRLGIMKVLPVGR